MNRPRYRAAVRCVGFAAVLAASVLAGCETAPRSPEPSLAGVRAPQRHVVRSAELRRLMQRLEALLHDRVQADLALDVGRNETADALADVAGELAVAASSMATRGVTTSLDEAGRAQFNAYALELRREAEILRAAAAERRFVASANQFHRLNNACAGCHGLFRAR